MFYHRDHTSFQAMDALDQWEDLTDLGWFSLAISYFIFIICTNLMELCSRSELVSLSFLL